MSTVDELKTEDVFAPLFSLPVILPPTAWAGHIPFLFVLMKLLKPKNYVELGVHYGASLLAAASAAKAYELPTQLSGIDTWQGDEHTGLYETRSVLDWLSDTVTKNFQNVTLVRSLFDEALDRFQPGSIDLLHIDGLHTYEAVSHDFNAWLPKMSSSGVVILHDTQIFDRGFGVFKLWQELCERYTTLEFTHCCGLGVVFLDPKNPAIKPLVEIARNPEVRKLYLTIAEGAGQALPARMRDLKLDVEHAKAERKAAIEVGELRSAVNALEVEAETYKMQEAARSYAMPFRQLFSGRPGS